MNEDGREPCSAVDVLVADLDSVVRAHATERSAALDQQGLMPVLRPVEEQMVVVS